MKCTTRYRFHSFLPPNRELLLAWAMNIRAFSLAYSLARAIFTSPGKAIVLIDYPIVTTRFGSPEQIDI